MKADKSTSRNKGEWPFMVQSRKPGDPAGPSAWWAQRAVSGNALDLDPEVFGWNDPRAIAQALKDAAEVSERRKAPAFQSAMSLLTFHINRSGKQLPAAQRACLEAAKNELRELYGRTRQDGASPAASAKSRPGERAVAHGAPQKFVERRAALDS
jgi:hypothetical protein